MFSFFRNLVILIFLYLHVATEGQIVFLHIPKTAGTTIHHVIENNFHRSEIYPIRLLMGDIEKFPSMIEYEFISGHFPYWFLRSRLESSSSFIFTVLREPIDRVLSHHRFRRKFFPHTTLEDIPPNMICRQLASDPSLSGIEWPCCVIPQSVVFRMSSLPVLVTL